MADTVEQLLHHVGGVVLRRGREDLAARVHAAADRASRPLTVVCVVGEFKQGKSLLVNALLGRSICPVDDDLSTAVITVIRHAAEPYVEVHVREDGKLVARRVPPKQVPAWVTEQGNPGNRRAVEQVVIGLDHPLLARGLAIVDTPGVGGLAAGPGAATTAFLPHADALLFVSDTSAELSAPELDFLRTATERCPSVLVVATKTDLYPSWRRIVELDRAHLAAVDTGLEVVPVSATAAIAAIRTADAELARASGFPRLHQHLVDRVLDRSRTAAARRSLEEADDVVAHLLAATRQEYELAADPGRLRDAQRAFDDAAAHLQTLKGGGARWHQLLSDRMSDLSNQVTFQFRSGIRELGREMDAAIEELATPEEWDELAQRLQQRVADLLGEVFAGLDAGVDVVHRDLAELLDDEVLALARSVPYLTDEVASLTLPTVKGVEARSASRQVAGGVISAMRGAQSGLYVFGFLARIVPAGAAALLFSNPVTLVLGAAFAGKQVAGVRRNSLAQRRQQARGAVRQFLDDVQFDLSNRLGELIRERQRAVRDETTARVDELQRTYQDLAAAAKADAARVYEDQTVRVGHLRDEVAALEQLRRDIVAVRTSSDASS